MNDSRTSRSNKTTPSIRSSQTFPVRKRHRRYNLKFKIGAVKLITEQGYSTSEAARRLGIDRTNLKNWLQKLAPDFDPIATQAALNSDDPTQLRHLLQQSRKEIDRLRMECDILKKATAYFAKEQL